MIPPDMLPILGVAFFAAFVQTSSGFGSSIVGMPLFTLIVGVQTAAPLVALQAVSIELPLLLYYRRSFNPRAVGRLIVSAVFGIPFGLLALRLVPKGVVVGILGGLLISYALYALVAPRLPPIHRSWARVFGFIAGCLGGAYNITGPPIIVYGNLQHWPRNEFKSNLQGFFFTISTLIVVAHAFGGNMNAGVWTRYTRMLPAIALGLVAGVTLDRHLETERFRKLVLVLTLALGITLLL